MVAHDAKGRSKKRGGQFMPISHLMARSPAWRSLSGAAVKVYVEMRSRFNGGNNGELALSYQQAADLLHLGKSTVARAFEELEAKGFIVKTSEGQWYGRRAATWAVTDRPLAGHPASNEWQNWGKRNSENGTETGRKTPLRAATVPMNRARPP